MRIAIVGASGNAGRAVAGLLRRATPHDLLLLGRTADKLTATAEWATTAAREGAVETATFSGPHDLPAVLHDVDVVVMAAPLSGDVGPWARAVLEAGADWFDLLLSVEEKRRALAALATDPRYAHRCLVTDGGVHPGVPGALVRWAAGRMDARSVRVSMRFAVDWGGIDLAPETVREFADELRHYEPRLYRGGRWVRGWRYAREVDFGPGIGRKGCAPMFLAELEEVQRLHPELAEVGFWVAGFGFGVDYLAMPLSAVLAGLGARGGAARVLAAALSRFGDATGPSRVILEAGGPDEGAPSLSLSLTCSDAYRLTAAPVVAALMQWDDRRRPGLDSQALFVEPERWMSDLAKLGVEVA